VFFILTRERVVLKRNPTMSNPSDVLNHLRNDTLQGMETASFYFYFYYIFSFFLLCPTLSFFIILFIYLFYLIWFKQIFYDVHVC